MKTAGAHLARALRSCAAISWVFSTVALVMIMMPRSPCPSLGPPPLPTPCSCCAFGAASSTGSWPPASRYCILEGGKGCVMQVGCCGGWSHHTGLHRWMRSLDDEPPIPDDRGLGQDNQLDTSSPAHRGKDESVTTTTMSAKYARQGLPYATLNCSWHEGRAKQHPVFEKALWQAVPK
eukprot:742723-Pelagomonas_calceolata.AAC.8